MKRLKKLMSVLLGRTDRQDVGNVPLPRVSRLHKAALTFLVAASAAFFVCAQVSASSDAPIPGEETITPTNKHGRTLAYPTIEAFAKCTRHWWEIFQYGHEIELEVVPSYVGDANVRFSSSAMIRGYADVQVWLSRTEGEFTVSRGKGGRKYIEVDADSRHRAHDNAASNLPAPGDHERETGHPDYDPDDHSVEVTVQVIVQNEEGGSWEIKPTVSFANVSLSLGGYTTGKSSRQKVRWEASEPVKLSQDVWHGMGPPAREGSSESPSAATSKGAAECGFHEEGGVVLNAHESVEHHSPNGRGVDECSYSDTAEPTPHDSDDTEI